ncbi:hypothetical protein EV421DRAFT_1743178 [Armillaria borealis]|uniref:Uncharacterized protein n=1 Tax=Armillaria borealis TaxID=47425 RepID=A0AA39MEI6_9AGAR|nr:hypothetical protein EV421DRAFT_1743178 [Armillaria borealis]
MTGAWHPNCPTLSKEHTTWLNENAMIGYAQVITEAQAQSTGTQVRGPGVEYVKDNVLNAFLEEFWSADGEPNTMSVLLFSPIIITESLKAMEKYQVMADEVNACVTEPPSLSEIYQNQSLIDQATTSLLECMIRFGPGQLGKVAWIAYCMYEDADGKAAISDNDLNSEEYFNTTIKWAAHGFEGDKSTVPSESQKTATVKANPKPAKHHDQPLKSSDSTSCKDKDIAVDNDNNDKDDSDGDEDDEDDESTKVKAALANAAAAKAWKEKAVKEVKEQVEHDVREKQKAMKKAEGKADKRKGRERKRSAEEDVTPPPPVKRGHLAKVTTEEPWHSCQAGKDENPENYKLADGKYKGR